MDKLVDILVYILQNYPSNLADELSNARLTKMVYLSDWHAALNRQKQISKIEWYFDNHGPYVHDVINLVSERNDLFEVESGSNYYGGKKRIIRLKDNNYRPELTAEEEDSILNIIKITKKLYWSDFINLVYGTYPIASSNRYCKLDLVQKAGTYQKQKEN